MRFPTKTFKLFEDCILVDGYARSAIYDIARSKIHLIPNSLYKLLSQSGGNFLQINEFKDSQKQDINTFQEYIVFLDDNELGFFCELEEISQFPPISNSFNTPNIISNSIIDIDKNSLHNYSSLFEQLSGLFCYHIQLRFHYELDLNELIRILDFTRENNFTSINLILSYESEIFEAFIGDKLFENYLISIIEFYNCPTHLESEYQIKEKNNTFNGIFLSLEKNFNETKCGIVNSDYFTINLEHLNEAKLFNSCLNKKISIDKNGYIKNCPSINKHYGTLSSTSLKEVIQKDDFSFLWKVTKDEISICKSCEFRYACTDCRAYTNGGLLGKPLKCDYDPFSATWKS